MSKRDQAYRMRTMEQISAGGVVVRREFGTPEIVIVKTVSEGRWQLPKGIIDKGETFEEAATREVREESGAVAEVVAPINTIEYWFVADRQGERVRYHKFVHFYLMKYISGDVADHDHEVEEAKWIEIQDAASILNFKSEREVVLKALDMISDKI